MSVRPNCVLYVLLTCRAGFALQQGWVLTIFASPAVRSMMFGFGDEQTPRGDSVRLMEEMVLEYITALVGKVRHPWSHFALFPVRWE